MPILVLQLEYNNLTKEYKTVEIYGTIPRQPIELTEYNIKFSEDGTLVKCLYVSLPFLNSYDVNTNYPVKNAFPLFLENYYKYDEQDNAEYISYINYSRQCSYEFNLGNNVPQSFNNWRVYYNKDEFTTLEKQGELFQECSYKITLIFNYRRPELI
jgi:hypothetical protein